MREAFQKEFRKFEKDIIAVIRQKRIQLGLAPEHFGRRLSLSEDWWENVENGKERLGLKYLQDVTDILEIPLADLIKPESNTDLERAFYKKMIADRDEQIKVLQEEQVVLIKQFRSMATKVLKKLPKEDVKLCNV